MGMSGDTALTLAKSYVKKTLQGQGALKGQDGFSPIVTENKDNTDDIYKLDITTKNGTFTTPNLIGSDGVGEENVIESIKVNGVAQTVDTDKSVDITVPTKTSDLSNDSNYQTADDITATLAPYAKSADVTTEITTEVAKIVADKVDKTSIATNLSSESTNDEVVGAKLAYDELKKVSSETKEQFATASGESISVNDSVDGKIRDLKLYGKSEQKQYSGKNLAPITLASLKNLNTDGTWSENTYTYLGVSYKINTDENGNITSISTSGTSTGTSLLYLLFKNLPLTEGTNYILNGSPSNADATKWKLDVVYETGDWKDTGSGVQFTFTEGNAWQSRIVVYSDTSMNYTFYPMIRLAAIEDSTYEPYTGGIPSPNPNYPQEIKSVVNPVVKSCGKNLLNPTLGTSTNNGVTCTNNGDGTYTLNGTATEKATFFLQENIPLPIGKFRFLGCPKGGEISTKYSLQFYRYMPNTSVHDIGEGKTYNNTSTMIFSRVIINIYKGYTCNNLVFKPMITTDINATYDDFEPYKETTATLPYTLNAIPVESGGNVTIDGQQYISDYVDFEKKQLVRMVKYKNVSSLDPSRWSFRNDVSISNATRYSGTSSDIDFISGALAISNIMKIGTENEVNIFRLVPMESYLYQFNLNPVDFPTIDTWKDYLANNDVYIIYQLATPTTIDLTDEEVQAFKELSTYYPTTNVFVTSDQLNGYAECKYPTTDVSGIASKNEAKIAEIEKNVTSVNNDLGGLKFSVSDGTLSITDGVNTWTLPQTT